jgi:uncharacterized RDD family membrane protein YckC
VVPDQDRFVTGEAVALDLRVARAGSRMLAFGIDVLILIGLLLALILLAGWLLSGRVDEALAAAVFIAVLVVCFIGLPVTMETLTRGRSVGKLALGLRVVRDDGGPIRFRQAFVRALAGLFELYLFTGVPALITSLASRQGKRVGDYMAGTIVLQERVPARGGPPVPMPPQLAPWAYGADLSGVSDSLALAARQFLSRAQELHPAARAQLEAQLAGAMAAVVAPPPPPGTPGWALLAAVLAERRRRDELRRQPVPASPTPTQAGTPSAASPPPLEPSPPPPPPGGFTPPG